MSLTYGQELQVKRIVEDKLSQHSFLDNINSFFEKVRLDQQIREKTETIVPHVCQNWINNNMRIETESAANNYMRNNFGRFFKQEVSENKDINGFIATHLQSVKDQVETTANGTVRKIVDTSTQFNPIFEKHLEVLSERNKAQLDAQLREIQQSKAQLDTALKENAQLNKKIGSLKGQVNNLTGLTVCSFAGIIGLGCSALLKTRSCL